MTTFDIHEETAKDLSFYAKYHDQLGLILTGKTQVEITAPSLAMDFLRIAAQLAESNAASTSGISRAVGRTRANDYRRIIAALEGSN